EGSLEFNRVLRGDDEEGAGQWVGLPLDRHLPLLHRLEECRLRAWPGAVDLIGKDDVGEDRPGVEGERRAALVEDERAGDVGWEQVRCELDAVEGATKG